VSDLMTAVETIRNEIVQKFSISPTIRLSIFCDTKMAEEDATKIAEELAKELGLSSPQRGSRKGVHWVSAERWAPNVEVTVFYVKEEDRCSQCPWKETK
jgi:hypothetical protein